MVTLLNCKNCFGQNAESTSNEIFERVSHIPTELHELLINLACSSPYINNLLKLEHQWLQSILDKEIEKTFNQLLNRNYVAKSVLDLREKLQIAKRRSNLLIIIADFGGLWDLAEVTKKLSIFAERVLYVSLNNLVFNEFKRSNCQKLMIKPTQELKRAKHESKSNYFRSRRYIMANTSSNHKSRGRDECLAQK